MRVRPSSGWRSSSLGLGPARLPVFAGPRWDGAGWLATLWAADVPERTEDTGPHGQNRRSPKLKPRYAILMLAQGWTPSAAAEALERDPHTIGRWASAFISP